MIDPGLDVDIVINNFNYDAYLADAIDSACGQTHERVRVIAVDDGSTDESRKLLGEYEDRVTVVLKETGGQASALNAGAAICRGQVTMFLDADDVLGPTAAADVAAAFAADPALVKAQFRMNVIDGDGNPTGAVKPEPHLPTPSGDVRRAELASPFDLVWMATSGNAFRTEALRRILPIPEGPFRDCPDWYLVHLTALLGPVASLDRVDASYRVHGDNSYEPQGAELDLSQLRKSIRYANVTSSALLALAAEIGLAPPQRILSVADLANRMISLRLDRASHPIETDSARSLLADAVGAVRRREGVPAAMKILFVAWFTAMAVAPRRAARRLAALFLFPERRIVANRALGRLHRRSRRGQRS